MIIEKRKLYLSDWHEFVEDLTERELSKLGYDIIHYFKCLEYDREERRRGKTMENRFEICEWCGSEMKFRGWSEDEPIKEYECTNKQCCKVEFKAKEGYEG